MGYVRSWPLWVRYVIAFGSGAIIVVALVLYVHHHQQPLSEAPAAPSKSQAAAEQHEDTVVVTQQQAPHTSELLARTSAADASAAVSDYMGAQVTHGFIAGPMDGKATCTAVSGGTARQVFHCRVTAGQNATKLVYPFDAVVQPAVRKVTYCQVVNPPIPSMTEPAISSTCT